jgi:hypothetical protein
MRCHFSNQVLGLGVASSFNSELESYIRNQVMVSTSAWIHSIPILDVLRMTFVLFCFVWFCFFFLIIVCVCSPQLGHSPPTLPILSSHPARTYMGIRPRWEPMWQYSNKIINIQVDITFIILKLIDGVPSHAKGVKWFKWLGTVTLVSNGEEFPHMCMQEGPGNEGGMGETGPAEWRCDLAQGMGGDSWALRFLL